MNYKDEQFRAISEAVMEQLGIEEVEDSLEVVPYEVISDEIVDLKEQIKKKDISINELELVIEHLSERIEKLERLFFEFRNLR